MLFGVKFAEMKMVICVKKCVLLISLTSCLCSDVKVSYRSVM